MDVYQIVTDKIVGMLEAGVVPWRKPWSSVGLPRNLVTKKPYRGINHFLLTASKYVSPFWLTFKQANELGGSVRRGEQSTLIIFWKIDQKEGAALESGDEEIHHRFLLRYYRAFNLEQCELPQDVIDKLPRVETHEHDPIVEERHRAFLTRGAMGKIDPPMPF
jgi:antirestriction protein ArdC